MYECECCRHCWLLVTRKYLFQYSASAMTSSFHSSLSTWNEFKFLRNKTEISCWITIKSILHTTIVENIDICVRVSLCVCMWVCECSAQCHVDNFFSTQLIISWLIACPFFSLLENMSPASNPKLPYNSLLAIVADNYEPLSDNMRLLPETCISISRLNILTRRKVWK